VVDDRGWIAVATVRLQSIKFVGIPVVPNAICAGLLLLVEYRDKKGHSHRGNYFLRGFTDSVLLARVDSFLGAGVFSLASLSLKRTPNYVEVNIPREFVVHVCNGHLTAPETTKRSDDLFSLNLSGIVKMRKRLWYFPLDKTHWKMRSRAVTLIDDSFFNAWVPGWNIASKHRTHSADGPRLDKFKSEELCDILGA
jgi:hypothetical protein